jgi:dTDP-4-dehydrorhamnose 3,5-epimerase
MVIKIDKNLKITDLNITPLKQIYDDRGAVFHYLRSDSKNFKAFGESYFSIVNPLIIKGWKYHTKIYQNFCVPHGAIKFVVFDNRENSITKGVIQEIILDNHLNYSLLSMPPELWYSFKCISKEASIISNIIDVPHTSDESKTMSIINNEIPYEW